MTDDFDDDDVPWADPAIRADFEATLGAFILAFNEVDYWVGRLLHIETERQNKPHLYDPRASFAARVQMMEALAVPEHRYSGIDFTELREINQDRNRLAYGHFDQNPFDGSYEILEKQKRREFPIDRVRALATRLKEIANDFQAVYAFSQFNKLDGLI